MALAYITYMPVIHSRQEPVKWMKNNKPDFALTSACTPSDCITLKKKFQIENSLYQQQRHTSAFVRKSNVTFVALFVLVLVFDIDSSSTFAGPCCYFIVHWPSIETKPHTKIDKKIWVGNEGDFRNTLEKKNNCVSPFVYRKWKNGGYIRSCIAHRWGAYGARAEFVAASTSGWSISIGETLREHIQCKYPIVWAVVRYSWRESIESKRPSRIVAQNTYSKFDNYVMFLCERHTLNGKRKKITFDITSPAASHRLFWICNGLTVVWCAFLIRPRFFVRSTGIHAVPRRREWSAEMSKGGPRCDQLCAELLSFS